MKQTINRRNFIRSMAGLYLPAAYMANRQGVASPFFFGQQPAPAGGGASDPNSLSGVVAWWSSRDATKLYKETTFTTQVSADADAINGIRDKTVNGNDLVATTSVTTQATYKINIKNSLPVIRFNGTASQFSKTLSSLGAHTIIAAFVETNTSGSGYGTLLLGNASFHGLQMKRQATSNYQLDVYTGIDNDSANIAAGTWSLWTVTFDGAGTMTCRKNGTAYLTGTASYSSNVYDRVGGHGGEWMQGDLGDLAIWNRVLSGAEITSMESYFTTAWGSIP